MRSFTLPGEVLELVVNLDPPVDPGKATAKTSVRKNGRPIASGGIEMIAKRDN